MQFLFMKYYIMLNNIKKVIWFPMLCALCLIQNYAAFGQLMIDSIIIERTSIQKTGCIPEWQSMFSSTLSDAHFSTIGGLQIGDNSSELEWSRAEKALRATALFSSIAIETDTIDQRYIQLYIKAQQVPGVNSVGLDAQYGGGILSFGPFSKTNVILGDFIQSYLRVRHRTENSIGNELAFWGKWNDILDNFTLETNVLTHSVVSRIGVSLQKNIYPQGGLGYGMSYDYSHGSDFVFTNETAVKKGFSSYSFDGWTTWLLPRQDNLYLTIKGAYQFADRQDAAYMKRAFDNTSELLISFSSLADKTKHIDGVDIPLGAWGSAILGRVIPKNQDGYYYVGGSVEQSALMLNDKLYMYGKLSAGSGLNTGLAINTALEFEGLAHFMINRGVLLAARIQQTSVWNWDAFRQQILDNDIGIRGLKANSRTGDNRMISTLELRHLLKESLYGFEFGFTLFCDAGTVWDKGNSLFLSTWSNSIGAGIIVLPAFSRLRYDKPLLRIEYAFNTHNTSGNGIVLSTNYSFDLIKRHAYSKPQVFGTKIDLE